MSTEDVLKAIDEATSDEERLRLELEAIEDTAKPLDPLEESNDNQ